MNKKRRKTNYRKGLWAEKLCVLSLRLRGYRILEQRYKTSVGEIDIIASRGKNVAFIEVKHRQDLTKALESITPKNKHRVINAAKLFLSNSVNLSEKVIRFDAMFVTPPFFWPNHYCNAWQT